MSVFRRLNLPRRSVSGRRRHHAAAPRMQLASHRDHETAAVAQIQPRCDRTHAEPEHAAVEVGYVLRTPATCAWTRAPRARKLPLLGAGKGLGPRREVRTARGVEDRELAIEQHAVATTRLVQGGEL